MLSYPRVHQPLEAQPHSPDPGRCHRGDPPVLLPGVDHRQFCAASQPADCHRDPDGDRHQHAGHTDRNHDFLPDLHFDPDSHADSDSHSNRYPDRNALLDSQPDPLSYALSYPDTHAQLHAYAHANRYTDTFQHADGYPDPLGMERNLP
jgi:hypothetical protein